MAIENGEYVDHSIFFYAPSKPAPIVFALLFTVSFAWHIQQNISHKSWKFTGLLPWATLIFVAGYCCRAASAWHYDNVDLFIAEVVLVYAAPPVYELANYITLGRILYYVPYHSPLHPGRVITTFGGISAVVEILTANGASYSSNKKNSDGARAAGRAMLKAALCIQLAVIAAFLVLAIFFHRRCAKNSHLPRRPRFALFTLYASMTLLGIRTIYRTVEYFSISDFDFSGKDPRTLSPIIRYEWFFWVFEGIPMIINTYLLNISHPASYLPRKNNVYLAQDGVTEMEGPGYMDRRNFLMTCVDPFDLVGCFNRKEREERRFKFWEDPATAGKVVGRADEVRRDGRKGAVEGEGGLLEGGRGKGEDVEMQGKA